RCSMSSTMCLPRRAWSSSRSDEKMLGGRATRLPIPSPDPTMSDTPMISFRSVTKRFPNASAAAVGELSFDVAEGGTVVLAGPSGCGKTTRMRMITRRIEPTSGQIMVAGRDTAGVDPVELRRGIGYVIQSVGLLPHRDVAHNIATVPGLLGWDRGRVDARGRELSELFELDDELVRRYPSELSGA